MSKAGRTSMPPPNYRSPSKTFNSKNNGLSPTRKGMTKKQNEEMIL
jgi:hypothetical protein